MHINFCRRKKLNLYSLIFTLILSYSPSILAVDENPFNNVPETVKTGTATIPELNTIIQPVSLEPTVQEDILPKKAPPTFFYSFPTNSPNSTATFSLPAPGINSSGTKTALINFNNVNIIEYIRFVSRLSNKNFIFNDSDLQFNITIVSDNAVSIENIMAALIQELRIHSLSLIEDGDNFIIHRNPKVNEISRVVANDIPNDHDSTMITEVFLLNALDPEKAASILRPLTSENAVVEPLKESNYLIVSDLASNMAKISQLLKSIDAPNSGVVVGQYQSRQIYVDELIPLAQQIIGPIAQNQMYVLVPNRITNSIFIIASPFLVERSIVILQHLEQTRGNTGILNLSQFEGKDRVKTEHVVRTPAGSWFQNNDKSWMFNPSDQKGADRFTPPPGKWTRDYEGNWSFENGNFVSDTILGPKGKWTRDQEGNWHFYLDNDENFNPKPIIRNYAEESPFTGAIAKQNKFYIHKLMHRRGDSVEPMLFQLADTIKKNQNGNEDLIAALNSVRWLDIPNSLVFSGTVESLDKVRALIEEIDTPIRQVFIEMLILETTLGDNLNYGVSYGTTFGGGNTSGGEGFSVPTPLQNALATTGVTGLGLPINPKIPAVPLVPNGTGLGFGDGFNLGIIGQKITHCGKEFASIGALVQALHNRSSNKVISNPKLLIEDTAQAEIYVGENTPYRTQSVSNDAGSVLTSNYEYRDVGTRIKLTPYIGNSDIVSLDLQEEISRIIPGTSIVGPSINSSPGPTTELNRTVTRVHIPNEYFLVISGMIRNEEARSRNQVPCLGGIPLIGGAFSKKNNSDLQRNLIIFIRPKIIDTEEEIQNITKREQDIYKYNNCQRNISEYEVSEALDLLNIDRTLHPEGYDDTHHEMKWPL